ncbi:MAG: GNAT family N-acetyltransferase [Chloroflexi bacterium]|nr:GNAT family N-acetyltransferase [Chloroflexota bacterium]
MARRVERAAIGDKAIIRNLLQLYLYEFTEFHDVPMSKNGEYDYLYLDCYWTEKKRHPYLFFRRGELAGFALVREEEEHYSIAEFFVLRKFRQRGLGLACATDIIGRHKGKWKIEFLDANGNVGKFWGRVASNVANGEVEEGKIDNARSYIQFLTE